MSAALVLGAVPEYPEYYKYCQITHFSYNRLSSKSARKTMLVDFRHNPHPLPDELVTQRLEWYGKKADYPIFLLPEKLAFRFKVINEDYCLVSGLLITCISQIVIDIFREVPFEIALPVCEFLARFYRHTVEDIREYLHATNPYWRTESVDYKLSLMDLNSPSHAESFARARLLAAGFQAPQLQTQHENLLYSPDRSRIRTLYNEKTMYTDFEWINVFPNTPQPHLVMEVDGLIKYTDEDMLKSIHVQNSAEVALRDHDRDEALHLVGCRVVHVQFIEALVNDGASMIRKMKLAGVPESPEEEKIERQKLLRAQ
ncbi:hypothetical protein [Alloscardovia macacae]|nr:hypothetical protein [Alloscardovia macacae]